MPDRATLLKSDRELWIIETEFFGRLRTRLQLKRSDMRLRPQFRKPANKSVDFCVKGGINDRTSHLPYLPSFFRPDIKATRGTHLNVGDAGHVEPGQNTSVGLLLSL